MLSRFPKISVLTLLKLGSWKLMNKLTKKLQNDKKLANFNSHSIVLEEILWVFGDFTTGLLA